MDVDEPHQAARHLRTFPGSDVRSIIAMAAGDGCAGHQLGCGLGRGGHAPASRRVYTHYPSDQCEACTIAHTWSTQSPRASSHTRAPATGTGALQLQHTAMLRMLLYPPSSALAFLPAAYWVPVKASNNADAQTTSLSISNSSIWTLCQTVAAYTSFLSITSPMSVTVREECMHGSARCKACIPIYWTFSMHA